MTKNSHGFSRQVIMVFLIVASFIVVTAVLLATFDHKSSANKENNEDPLPVIDYKKRFEWADEIPYLYRASGMPPQDAVRLILQNSAHLRTYMAIQLLRGCSSESSDSICSAKLGEPALEEKISSGIDQEVTARLKSGGEMTSADISLLRQPGPFTRLIALKSHASPYASLVFFLTGGNGYSATRIKEMYGNPSDETSSDDSYVMTYKSQTTSYSTKTEFQVNVNSGEAKRVMISLQR
ncbi:MAG TPA: hypothetical protein VKS43_14885 [Burkholderiales bacterium]|nr:hypothetical protein [Burkholderiales bacterium]